jgi:hypothetical protein
MIGWVNVPQEISVRATAAPHPEIQKSFVRLLWNPRRREDANCKKTRWLMVVKNF